MTSVSFELLYVRNVGCDSQPEPVIRLERLGFHGADAGMISRATDALAQNGPRYSIRKPHLPLDRLESRLVAQRIGVLPEGERMAHVYQRIQNDQTPCGQLAH